MLSATKCNTINGSDFTSHTNPGPFHTFPKLQAQPQITQINATHKNQLRLWREQEIITKAIKNQLTNIFHASYLAELHDNYTGCNNDAIQEILECLHSNGGDLDENDLEANKKILTRECDYMEPSSVFVKRIEDCMDVAEEAGAPCTESQITNKAFSIILKADVFHYGIKEWRKKTTNDKTWSTFKQHFSAEMKEHRKIIESLQKPQDTK